MESESSSTRSPPDSRLLAWVPLLVFVLLACAIGGTGYFVSRQYRQRVQQEAHETLGAIADLRVRQVAQWREEILKNAGEILRDPMLADEIERWLQRGSPLDKNALKIFLRIKAVQQSHDFQAAFLLDEWGTVRNMPITPHAKPPTPHGVKVVMEAMRSRQAILTDLHEGAEAPRTRMDLAVPLLADHEGHIRAIAAIYFRIDPQQYLFPLLRSWPSSSSSAETMLLRREGDEAVALNSLRHRGNAAPQLRFPVAGKMLAALMARGEGGMVEGLDYRGIPVIGAARKIPDSPWFLVAKMDEEELYAPIRKTAWIVAALVFSLIGGAGMATGLWWRQQRAQFLARQYADRLRNQEQIQRSEQQTRLLLESAAEAIYGVNMDGLVTFANPACLRMLGYAREDELLGQHAHELFHHSHADGTRYPAQECCIYQSYLSNQVVHVDSEVLWRKDGAAIPVEYWSHPIRHQGQVEGSVITFTDITERLRYQSQLERQANYDELTGLANRNLFQDRLEQALIFSRRHDCGLAVIFIDLDNFKTINDSLGHDAGDALLPQVASRLAGAVREGDTVARQGGDEFVLLLTETREEKDVSMIAQKLLQAVSEPFEVGGRNLHITCSIGVASYPKDGEDRQVLLKNADAAMYRAKEIGRNNVQFFAEEMNVKAMERLMLENSLHQALERKEFLLHYQPQVDLRSGEIAGMEALVRWHHPELGLLSPARFIPVAEDSCLIIALGEWVLRTACAQNKAWQDAGLKPITVAVNLSARQFRQHDLVEMVTRVLRETGLDPAHLELEVTESLVMQNVEETIATLGRLKAMGIKLSIDDFGTGYSSLNYLKRFPVHTLKIDQSFVRDITTDPSDAAIAKTIISMAHELGLKVIAEGVETEEQKSFLCLRRCDEMQGYFFSRPVPAAEFESVLRDGRRLETDHASAATDGRTLLLLDDEENILASLSRLLRSEGYKVLKATHANAALDLLAQNRVGVIISDQRMPQMSGVEFLRRVKRLYPDTVRMVLSGYTDLKSVTDAINEGAVYKFLTKPWDDEQLRANIQEAFRHYEMAQDNQRLTDQLALANEGLDRARRALERRIEQKTCEVEKNVSILQVAQEIFEYLPVGVIGVDEDGMIAVANRKANELWGAEKQQPLVGCFADERLPKIMIDCLAEGGECHGAQLENGRNVICWCRVLGTASKAEGRVLVIAPNELETV